MTQDNVGPMGADGGSEDFWEDLVRLDQELAARSGINLHAALDQLLTWVRRVIRADGGSIYLRHGGILTLTVVQNDTLEHQWGVHTVRSWLQNFALPVATNSIAGYVARTGDGVNVSDVEHIPTDAPYEFNPVLDRPTYRYRSILAVPIEQEPAGVLGVLQLINALDAGGQAVAFEPEAEVLARRSAVLAAHVIVNRAEVRPRIAPQ